MGCLVPKMMIGNGIGFFTMINNLVSRRLPGRAKCSAILCGLTIVMASCGGTSGAGGGGGTPAPTATLTATPPSTFPGQAVILSFTSTNADQGSITPDFGAVGANGSVSEIPPGTTTYIFTATGPGGTATATVTVTVNQITSFEGMKQSDGSQEQDVDPNGAIGTKQYLEYVNTSLRAFDKTSGAQVWASKAQDLWQKPSDCNPDTPKDAIQLDAFVIFDRLASRWLVGAKTSNDNPPNQYTLCIAVSNTDDLTAASLSWTPSSIQLDSLLGKNSLNDTYFPDWPKFATWTDASAGQSAYYASMDLLDLDHSSDEVGAAVCAFDRENILHNPSAARGPVCINLSHTDDARLWSGGLFIGHSLIPADIDGKTIPPSGRHEFMVSIQNPINDGTTTTSSSLNLWDFHVDWTPSTPTLTATLSPITVDSFTPGCYFYVPGNPVVTNCVLEPPAIAGDPPQLIDSVGDRLMPRFAYRNFGDHESYLVSHAIQTGHDSHNAEQTGVRWYELRNNGSGTLIVNQSDTVNPDDILYRFLPSIAQDKDGNVAAGYSTSNVFTDPGIAFSYWSLTQATPPAEIQIFQGLGEEVTDVAPFAGKWGTYSSMTVDPVDDCTFWYVNEYFDVDNTWRTRIANFKLPGCQ